MRPAFRLGTGVAVVVLAGCYHATVETGLPPGTQTVESGFAPAWIYGLVPPSPVSAAARCPDGVARVETQLSFVNMLVGQLTLGIFTPMSIKVTCAASGGRGGTSPAPDLTVPPSSSDDGIAAAIDSAAHMSARSGAPVFVRISRK